MWINLSYLETLLGNMDFKVLERGSLLYVGLVAKMHR